MSRAVKAPLAFTCGTCDGSGIADDGTCRACLGKGLVPLLDPPTDMQLAALGKARIPFRGGSWDGLVKIVHVPGPSWVYKLVSGEVYRYDGGCYVAVARSGGGCER